MLFAANLSLERVRGSKVALVAIATIPMMVVPLEEVNKMPFRTKLVAALCCILGSSSGFGNDRLGYINPVDAGTISTKCDW